MATALGRRLVLASLVAPAMWPDFAKGGGTMPRFVREAEFSVAGDEPDAGAFAWSPDGTRIAVLATLIRQASVFAIPGGTRLSSISDLAGGARAIDFAADGRVLIPSHHADAAALMLWDAATGQETGIPGPDGPGGQILTNLLFKFSLDGPRYRLAGLHRVPRGGRTAFSIAVYDAHGWRLLGDHPVNASAVSLSPDGARIAAPGQNGSVIVLDALSGRLLLTVQANLNAVDHIGWSPDGQRIATGTMGEGFGLDVRTGQRGALRDADVLQLWDAGTGTRIAAAPLGGAGGIESLDLSSDGRWLVSTVSDGTCRLWDAANLAPAQIVAEGLRPGTALARFSPDSRRLAVVRTAPARASLYRLQ